MVLLKQIRTISIPFFYCGSTKCTFACCSHGYIGCRKGFSVKRANKTVAVLLSQHIQGIVKNIIYVTCNRYAWTLISTVR